MFYERGLLVRQAKETAVVVAQSMVAKSTAFIGTLDEKMRAFDQVAANLATLQLNGWDSVQKVKAGCWLADGAGEHPAVFMENHYCMNMSGKLLIEPRWEYVHARLKSGLPGFKFKVIHKGEDYCELYFADASGNEHTEKYTMEYAQKQGHAQKDTYKKNPIDMLFKQCYKRGADIIGAHVIMGIMPLVSDWPEEEERKPIPTTAEAISAAIEKAAGAVVDVEFDEIEAADLPKNPPPERPFPPDEDGSPRLRLYALMTSFYGKMTKAMAIEKSSVIYNAMMRETTGVDPKVEFAKRGHIGPIEAEQMILYLKERMENKSAKAVEPYDDGAPEAEGARIGRTVQEAYDDLFYTVNRARKLFGRKFIQEAPPGSGKFWFTDLATFSQAGDEASVKIQVGGDIVAPVEKIEQLNRILTDSCDEKERNGR